MCRAAHRGLVKTKYSAEVECIRALSEILKELSGENAKCPVCGAYCDLALNSDKASNSKSVDIDIRAGANGRPQEDRSKDGHVDAHGHCSAVIKDRGEFIALDTAAPSSGTYADGVQCEASVEAQGACNACEEAAVVGSVTEGGSPPRAGATPTDDGLSPHRTAGQSDVCTTECGHGIVEQCRLYGYLPNDRETDLLVSFFQACMKSLAPRRKVTVAVQELSPGPSSSAADPQMCSQSAQDADVQHVHGQDGDLVAVSIKMFITREEFWTEDFLKTLVQSSKMNGRKQHPLHDEPGGANEDRATGAIHEEKHAYATTPAPPDQPPLAANQCVFAESSAAFTTPVLTTISPHQSADGVSHYASGTSTGKDSAPYTIDSPAGDTCTDTTTDKKHNKSPRRRRRRAVAPVHVTAPPSIGTYRDALMTKPNGAYADTGRSNVPNSKTGNPSRMDKVSPSIIVSEDVAGTDTCAAVTANIDSTGKGKGKKSMNKKKVVLTIGSAAQTEVKVQSTKVNRKGGVMSAPANGEGRKAAEAALSSVEVKAYCHRLNLIDADLNVAVLQLLERLASFQKKVTASPGMRNAKRLRFVCGLKESEKLIHSALDFLQSQVDADNESRRLMIRLMCPLKCVVIPPNLQVVPLGSLEKRIDDLTNNCGNLSIPLICALSRNALGRACQKSVRQSAVGIVNVEGAFTEFKNVLASLRRRPTGTKTQHI